MCNCFLITQQFVDLRHDLESVGDVEHVGLAARPATVRVEINGAALADEAPAHRVRLFAVATGRKSFRMPRRRAGLADLVHMRQEWQNGLSLTAQIHK